MQHPQNPPNRNRETRISSLSRGIDSNWDFGSIWICTAEFEFLDFEGFGGAAFSVEGVMYDAVMYEGVMYEGDSC